MTNARIIITTMLCLIGIGISKKNEYTYNFLGCYAHTTGVRIETWDTTGLTLNSCASQASARSSSFFVSEFPQGYSATFRDPVASCGIGGDFTLDGQIDSAYCLFRVHNLFKSIRNDETKLQQKTGKV